MRIFLTLALTIMFALLTSVVEAEETAQAPRIHFGSMPGEFVLKGKILNGPFLVDVANVRDYTDGTRTAHAYRIQKSGELFDGIPSRYQDILMQYNCKTGSFIPLNIIVGNESFSIVGTITIPAGAKPWTVAQRPELADLYGYAEVCGFDEHTPRIGKGQNWMQVAANIVKEIRVH